MSHSALPPACYSQTVERGLAAAAAGAGVCEREQEAAGFSCLSFTASVFMLRCLTEGRVLL